MTALPLLLASNSPRRRELLALAGLPFTIRPADLDEDILPGEDPRDYGLRTARDKAQALGPHASGHLILAADTVVELDGESLGKPEGEAGARAMLERLSGRWHTVYTALAAYQPDSGRLEQAVVASQVRLRALSEAELSAYIASGDPFDKAGGYAIQNPDFNLVEEFHGCYNNIIGLPLCAAAELLARFGLSVPLDLPPSDDPDLPRSCPVCQKMLASA